MTNSADFEDNMTLCVSELEMLHRREFKDSAGPAFAFDMSVSNNNQKIDTSKIDTGVSFAQNLAYWRKDTQILSANNLDNPYYRNIVDMGIDAVPFIYQEIKKRPSFLVRALDRIFPGVVEYGDGYVSIEDACNTWVSILSQIDNVLQKNSRL